MSAPFVDTDVIIRLLTGDDPVKQEAAKALFQRIEEGKLTVAAPDTVIADAVFVLSSTKWYHLPRPQVSALLLPLVRLPHFRIRNRRALLRALQLYAITNLDFSDLFIAASMQQARSQTLYSYDRGFDRLPGISRKEPERP